MSDYFWRAKGRPASETLATLETVDGSGSGGGGGSGNSAGGDGSPGMVRLYILTAYPI